MLKILFAGFRHRHIWDLYKKAVNKKDIQIIACVEPDAQARAIAEQTLGAKFDNRGYDYWLEQDIDIVAIGSRYGERGGMIIKALNAKKHIISDKPICITKEELEQISELSQKRNLKIGCMFDLRYLPSTLAAKQVLRDGLLGEVRNISFFGQHCIDYANRPSWYFEKGMHGGTINDLAIHGLDLVSELTGLTVAKTHAARTWNAYAYKNPDFKDCAIFMSELNNGAGLLADISYSAPSQVFSMPTYWDFKIWCEKGLLTFNAVDETAYIYQEGHTGVQKIVGPKPQTDYIDDIALEIKNNTDTFTKSVLKATRQALDIQELANGK
jgi:predicted dehydrogenase